MRPVDVAVDATHPRTHRIPSVAIVSPELVGTTTAYALRVSGAAAEIVLSGRDRNRVEAQVKDLREAALYSHATRVVAGDFTDCANADVVIVTVDAPQHRYKGSRLDELKISAAMVKEVMTARLGFLVLQGKGIERSRSTHTKKTANASELKTTMIQ